MNDNRSSTSQQGGGYGHQNNPKKPGTPIAAHMTPFKGIELRVRFVDMEANIGFSEVKTQNGLLSGRLNADPARKQIELFVKIDDASFSADAGRLIVFTRGKDLDIRVHASNHRRGKSTYRQTVEISRAHDGSQVSVNQTTNNLYVAFMLQSVVIIKAIALVYQDGAFYVLAQDQYCVEAFITTDGKVALPGFHEKHGGLPTFVTLPEVAEFLASVPSSIKKDLEHVTAYKRRELKTDGLGPDEGVVSLYTLRRQNGVIVLGDGREARVHWRDIIGMGPKALRTGQIVRFERLERITPEQQRNQRTTLQWDARGLTLRP